MTSNARARFLETLRTTSNVTEAARQAGHPRQSFYKLREADEEFARAWADAQEEATDTLEAEARRRAYEGCKKPVYQKGQLVGYVQEYSDTLMLALLRAHRPDRFRERASVEMSGPDGGAIRIDPDAHDRLGKALGELADRLGGEE